jgi:putative FmdB family regulatory protein
MSHCPVHTMPIYEYQCASCNECFEKLVFGSNPEVACPKCGSKETEKRLSKFGMGRSSNSGGGSGCGSCSSSSCAGCK